MDHRGRRSSRKRWESAYTDFRARLVRAREALGLSQRDAAKRLGRSQSFVAKSESGERRVDVVELAEFAAVYGKHTTFFLLRAGKAIAR